jgi:hypothetical protein
VSGHDGSGRVGRVGDESGTSVNSERGASYDVSNPRSLKSNESRLTSPTNGSSEARPCPYRPIASI